MEPADLLQAIEDTLRTPVEELGGSLYVCEDEVSALQLLEEGPGNGWLCLLLMTGGQPVGRRGGTHDFEIVTVTAYLGKPAGMPINPSAGLYRDTAAGKSLLTRVTEIRRLMQRLKFVEPYEPDATDLTTSDQVDSAGCVFTGWRILGPEDSPEDSHAARLTFTLTVAFSAPSAVPLPVTVTPSPVPT